MSITQNVQTSCCLFGVLFLLHVYCGVACNSWIESAKLKILWWALLAVVSEECVQCTFFLNMASKCLCVGCPDVVELFPEIHLDMFWALINVPDDQCHSSLWSTGSVSPARGSCGIDCKAKTLSNGCVRTCSTSFLCWQVLTRVRAGRRQEAEGERQEITKCSEGESRREKLQLAELQLPELQLPELQVPDLQLFVCQSVCLLWLRGVQSFSQDPGPGCTQPLPQHLGRPATGGFCSCQAKLATLCLGQTESAMLWPNQTKLGCMCICCPPMFMMSPNGRRGVEPRSCRALRATVRGAW